MYPGTLVPKMHYLLHQYLEILAFGSLRNFNCERFEAFHSIIKTIVQKARNLKNVSQTASERVQAMKAFQLTGDHALPPSVVFEKKVVDVRASSVPVECRASVFAALGCKETGVIQKCDHVKWHGQDLLVGAYCIADMVDDEPVFFLIDAVFVSGGRVALVGRLVPVAWYEEHFGAFVVEPREHTEQRVALPSDFVCEQTLQTHMMRGHRMLRWKYMPCALPDTDTEGHEAGL